MRPASDLNLLEIALRSRAEKIRGYIKSSARVVELLKPEMVKFEARTGHDVYTVRMSVDHASSIRTQTKEAEELEQAADALAVIEADRKEAREEVVREIIQHLIEDNGRCDCFAHSVAECACGGWDDYKRKPLLDVADEIGRKFLSVKPEGRP